MDYCDAMEYLNRHIALGVKPGLERLAINGRFATEKEFALAVSDVAAFAELRE